MDYELFRSSVEQAVELGYRYINLTPCTGDVFMDRNLSEKLHYLDNHPMIKGYSFFTNFTIPRKKDIDKLFKYKKFKEIVISVYGHDRDSFVAMTNSSQKIYDRLVSNLDYFLSKLKYQRIPVRVSFHSACKTLIGKKSALIDALRSYSQNKIKVRTHKLLYNNWGGMVSDKDVEYLPITVLNNEVTSKNGACRRLFDQFQIMSNGVVNGCACRDANATLRMGDLHEEPLQKLVSSQNPRYMKIIDDQQNGMFQEICKNCDFYSSIYHRPFRYVKSGAKTETLDQFKKNNRF